MPLPQAFIRFAFVLRVVASYNLDTSHPIIYEEPKSSEIDSYFGMSVAIRPKAASLSNTWSIQVGAPRGSAGGVGVRDSGTVHRCHIYGPCQIFEMDKELSASGGSGVSEYKEKKDAAWVGVAMDFESFGWHERSVVCGHRWINQNLKNAENIDLTYLMTGVCYLQDIYNKTQETPVRRLLPLVNSEKIYIPKPYVAGLSTYHWGLGQAGLSVRIAEDSLNFLIGAPGVTHWIGSVIKYEKNSDLAVANFAKAYISKKSRYTYLGYSVAFGRFYKGREVWCVAGAPRSANYRGEVFTFQFKASSDDVRIRSNFMGATFGEYFGSSLATTDLNSDGFDDLVVGAPLFSSAGSDEGRIYVYLGTERGDVLKPAQVINGRIWQGRFGSCITSLKDLDQDGYNDVAVGAPYENDKRGAVYIFNGFSKGLQENYSQRIRAQDLHPHLRGFGVSISPPVDIDGNKYLDVAVGSYLSGHVVLIRSRPVVSLHSTIGTKNIIDRKSSYFNITVCSKYTGTNAPHYVDVTRVIDIDPVHRRGALDLKMSAYTKSIRLLRNEIICETHPVALKLSGKNFSPMQISVKTEADSCAKVKKSVLLIKDRASKGADGFLKTCPVGSKEETWKEIPFAGICGSDLTCRSDLELSCHVPDFRAGSYVLGSSEFLDLSLEVNNRGEPAYRTKIKIWSNLKLKRRDKEHDVPSDVSKNVYWLEVEGILTESYRTNFAFQIDSDALKGAEGKTLLNLTVDIFTSSSETNFKNNYCKFSVKLVSDAFLNLHASSSATSIYVTGAAFQNQIVNVTHYYEVQKAGVAPVKDVEFTIYIPFYFKKKFLAFEIETAEWMHYSDYCEKPSQKERKYDDPDKMEKLETFLPNAPVLFLNCSSEKVECKVLKIFFADGIPTGSSSYVKIIISINVSAIDFGKQRGIARLSTTGMLTFSKFLDKQPEELRKSASVSFYNEDSKVFVQVHVIALSVLAGGFLLLLIITGLARGNFFKRTKKQELQALRDANASFVYFSTGDNYESVNIARALHQGLISAESPPFEESQPKRKTKRTF